MGFCPRDPSKIGPVIGEYTPINSPILRWDFLLTSYSLSHSKQIWSTNRSVYTMFFIDFTRFCAQILAFAICFSWILLVGAVQANTEISNVWKTHENTNNLKFKKAWFSAKSQRFARFLLANPPARVRPDTFAFWTECESWWRAKSSRNRPETARVQNRYFSKGF